jgi:preprotein translocase subunit SecE
MSRFTNYIRDTRGELAHVSWPTRKQAIGFTVITILISLIVAFYLGFFDYIFSLIIQKFVL